MVRVDNLNVREGPGTEHPVQTVGPGAGPESGNPIRVDAGRGVWVVAETVADSARWYQVVVDASFHSGWINAGPDSDLWVVPFDPANCPASADDALADRFLMLMPMQALVCFGSERVAVIAYWPTPDATGVDVPCPWGEPRWLHCYEYVNKSGDGTRSLAVYGTTELPAFERGRWWTVIGHFDDPRCADPGSTAQEEAESVLFCRTRFVVDALGQPPVP